MISDTAITETERSLWGLVAYRLAGRPVTIHWRRPPEPGKIGSCRRAGEKAVIEVDPELTKARRLDVVLHELAHARLHWPTYFDFASGEPVPDFAAQHGGQFGRRAGAFKLAQLDKQQEAEADALRDKWLAWARARAMFDAPFFHLLCLTEYPVASDG